MSRGATQKYVVVISFLHSEGNSFTFVFINNTLTGTSDKYKYCVLFSRKLVKAKGGNQIEK